MVAAAVAGSAVASAAGSAISGSQQSGAVEDAAQQSASVQLEGIRQQREIADRARDDLMPYANAGRNALMMTTDLAGVNGPEASRNALLGFVESPGRQYALEQGTRAIERTAAARGGLLSGNTLRQVNEFGQNLADQSFQTYYNRLSDLAKGGQAAAAGQQQAGNVLSGQIGQASAGMAQTLTSAGGQMASIYGTTGSNIGGALQSGLSNYMYQDRLNQAQPKNALYDYAQPNLGGNAEIERMPGGW